MLKPLFSFLRIIDEKSKLSITNLSVIAVVGKIVASGVVSYEDLIALGVVFANYAVKRAIVFFEDRTPTPSTIDVTALQENVAKLTKELEDAKNKISGLSLAAGVRSPLPPRRP